MKDISEIVIQEIEKIESLKHLEIDKKSAIERLTVLPEIIKDSYGEKSLDYWKEIRKHCCIGYGLKCARDIIEFYKDKPELSEKWKEAYTLAIENSTCGSCLTFYLNKNR